MIAELGLFALILATLFAGCQTILPTLGQRSGLSRYTLSCTLMQCGMMALSAFCLLWVLVDNDFTVLYVANHSNTHLPLFYRVGAFWGAHEGSLLLWLFILSGWTLMVLITGYRQLPRHFLHKILAVLGFISVGLSCFVLFTSNPFMRDFWQAPREGFDLNPLLQDPGLVSHPPILYMGYVGFSVVFAYAMAALWQGELDAKWVAWTRPWALISWSFLTLGITLGSWWAYRVLGWGGWWFWDPVENVSLMPWLVGTAFIHTLMVADKRVGFKSWTVLLSIIVFALSLVGTFLVRSGVLISVHTFASDPTRGLYLLLWLALIIGGALVLFMLRAGRLQGGRGYHWWSKESFLLLNNLFFICIMLTVLLGTLYPMFYQMVGWGNLSVGQPYFNAVTTPLLMIMLVLMSVAPHVAWRHANWDDVYRQPKFWLGLGVVACIWALWVWVGVNNYRVIIGGCLAGLIVYSVCCTGWRQGFTVRRFAMMVAHLAVAVVVIGITISTQLGVERQVKMTVGDHLKVGPYTVKLERMREAQGPNYQTTIADFILSSAKGYERVIHPENRLYTASQTVISKVDISVGWWSDVYIALGQPLSQTTWTVRMYYKPFVRWIWLGGIMMAMAGLLAAVAWLWRDKATDYVKETI